MTAADTQVAPAFLEKQSAPVLARQPRLWPPLVLVVLYWTGWAVTNFGLSGTFTQFLYLFWTPLLLALLTIAWWLTFSRLPWLDRLWGIGCLVGGAGLAVLLGHKTMAEPPVPIGMLMYAMPVAITAMIVWLAISPPRQTTLVRLGLVVASLVAWGYFTLVRIDGINGSFAAERSWRWESTPEDRYLASLPAASARPEALSLPEISASDWPEFRGAARDGVLRGVKLESDWQAHPPKLLWRRNVGPGWSSFATVGDIAFTQEQRGEQEAIVCFDVATGEEHWAFAEKARFYEVVAGAGPRATPTLSGGKLYTQGASGKLTCLDAATGKPVWSRDIAADAGLANPPQWGFSSSPLITDGAVITFAGGKDGKSVLAYDAATGEPKWNGGKGTHSYSSPQLYSSGGVDQVLMLSDQGLESFDPQTGTLVWEHPWFLEGMFRVCQPHVLADDSILISTGMGMGTKLLTVARDGPTWQVAEKWFSKDFSPYFNDCVSHEGYLYGFDGAIFVCVDLATGKKQWKKGRYGHGQVLLVADQGLLVVISEEEGELILLEANPQQLVEHGRLPALKGKTWNHPVITGNLLLVRNAEEMACFELARE